MHARNWLAWLARPSILATGRAAAHGMVENKNPIGASRRFQESLGLRVVDPSDLFLIVEVAHQTAVLHERKSLFVKRYLREDRSDAADLNFVRLVHDRRPRHASGRFVRVGARPLPNGCEIIQLSFNGRQNIYRAAQAHEFLAIGRLRSAEGPGSPQIQNPSRYK